MEKSFRVHTNIGEDTLLHVDMRQDFDFLEILSLKLGQSDAYRLHSSNYGVIVGRVLANDAFGIPNARVSMFVERDTNDTTDLERIYPYSELFDKDKDGRRYNLLPDYSDDKCYRVVGTFPNKRFLLDNDTYIEVYEKYWKYTTVTNAVGDYMLFGVPSGSQQIHVDIDLSDIGILSQKPRDFEYKGYEITQFDNSSQFKESTNLDNLSQLFTENKGVTVYPFWGDSNNGPAAITRSDVQIQYKFEPTCVFMGSIISDNDTNSIGHKCAPSVNTGKNNQLVAGEGTIEMIRVTTDGLVEDFQIQGNRLIDSDGVWCYQIPMNLDYIGMDEYGNIVATNDPSKGIPTRTRVRFRISKTESGDEGFSRHTAKYLVPNNPEFDDTSVIPKIKDPKRFNRSYVFGSATPRECFRDLYWNNVYSVKNYIPKTQVSHRATSKNYNSLKSANFANDKNTLPFNKLFIDVKFSYMIICILFYIVIKLLKPINAIINALMWLKYKIRIPLIGLKIFGFIPDIECIPIAAGLSDDSKAYYPGCRCPDSPACKISKCPEDAESGKCEKSSDDKDLIDKVQQNLANEYELVNLDLQNDWINGALYMPLWYWRKAKKKRFLFWTIRKAKSEFCDCDKKYPRMKTYLTCDIKYDNNSLKHTLLKKEKKWHKSQKKGVWFPNGLIKPVENKDGLTVYYYVSANPRVDQDPEGHPGQKTAWYDDLEKYPDGFYAVRLFATDIILLGSLWENNMYGIPQLFKNLPSTTSNVPAISTIVENTTDVDDDNSTSDAAVGTESGITITTGMDCGYKGEKQNPQYSTGLFMDLSCTAAKTYEKSCINVERLSEYGVSLDMSYKMPYAQGGDIQYGEILPDGFISKYELDDTENRAMFATMNHVGFYPQDTRDIVHRTYDTQVDDKYTRYPIPKMQYIYPVDFDGRMDESMKAYTSTNTFKQLTREGVDEAYLTFRLGGEADNTNTRVRHFYYTKDALQMPVYNNSFYFYFGANKGNTAIEKFHKLFWADCFQNNKYPFSLVIEKNPKSYCPDAYKDECATMKYGYIRVILEDILTDYSYTLYDSYNRVVVSEQMMTARDFVIGGFIDGETGVVKSNPGGVVQPQSQIFGNVKTVVEPQEGYVLENGTYRLSVTDVNGKTVTERVTLDQPKISLSYTTTDIGTRFYDTERTSISYICNDEYDFYGVISITGIFVDGVEYTFQDGTLNVIDEPVRGEGGKYYTVTVSGSGECVEGDKLQAIIKISLPEKAESDDGEETEEEPDKFADCMCDNDNRYSNGILVAESMGMDIGFPYYYHPYTAATEEEKRIEFYVYQPNQYLITVTQLCNEVPMDETYDGVPNSTTYTATIRSGEDFDVALNTMPLRFMLGSTTDSASMEISKNSHFYGKVVETNLEKSDISGWFGVHHEQVPYKNDKNTSPYQFWRYPTNKNNEQIWTNYVNIEDGDVDSVVSKSLIAQYKFRTMFALANGVYCSNEFTLQASGGTSPILYRSVLPDYAGEAFTTENQDVAYILGTTNTTTVVEEFPNIVTKYFLNMHNGEYTMSDSKSQGPIWNIAYGKKANNMVGNYFAAFTNNGGYTSSGEAIDKKKGVLRAPSMASVSPVNGEQNNLIPLNTRYTSTDVGKNFKPAHTQMKQRLTGDKERTVNPYMRALNVDRRIDFNFLVFAPILSKSFDINEENPITWRGGRVSGMTFNGIEMSYTTRNHNIIDADWREYYSTDDGWKASSSQDENAADVEKFYGATPNKRLEYSYNAIQTGDAQQDMTFDMDGYTVYNYGNDYVWERDTDETSLKKQINKRLYGAMIGSNDVRDYFWSEGNENRMRKCIADTQAHSGDTDSFYTRTHINFCGDIGNDAYIFPHTMDEAGYNGDFNMFQYLRNYPTKRLLDIGGLKTRANYTFSFTPCSYSISAEMLENGKLEAEAGEGDSLEFSIDFTNPVVFTTPNADNQEYYNSLYNVKKDGEGGPITNCGSGDKVYVYEPTVFESVSSEVYFTPAQRSNSDFRIRIGAPRVIAVLPYPLTNSVDQHNSKDAITAIKLSTTKKQLYEKIGYEPLNAKKNLALQMVYASEKSGSVVLSGTKVKNAPKGVKLLYAPSSVDPNDLYMYLMKNKKEHLHSDDTDTQSVMFYNKFKVNKNRNKTPLVYCVLMENEYVWQNEDGLVRGMRVLEFSDLIDVRDIKIQCAIQTTDQIETYTYIQKRDVNAEESSSGGDDQGGGDSGGGDSGGTSNSDEKNQVVVQYLAFNVHIDDGVKGTNQAFYDWENMSFAIKVNNKYYINAYNFENGDRLPFFNLSTQDSASVTDEVLEKVFGYDEAVEYVENGESELVTTSTTGSVTSSLISAIHAIGNDKYAVVQYDYKLLTTACTASDIYTHMPELDFTQNVVSESDCDVYPTTSANTKACNMVVYEKGNYVFTKAVFSVTATIYTSTTTSDFINERNQINSDDWHSATTFSGETEPYVIDEPITSSTMIGEYVIPTSDVDNKLPQDGNEALSFFTLTEREGQFLNRKEIAGATRTGYTFPVNSREIPIGGDTAYGVKIVEDGEMFGDDGGDVGHVEYATTNGCGGILYQVRYADGEPSVVPDERANRKIQNVLVHFMLDSDMNILDKMKKKDNTVKCKFYAKTASNYTYCLDFKLKLEGKQEGAGNIEPGESEGAKVPTYVHIVK